MIDARKPWPRLAVISAGEVDEQLAARCSLQGVTGLWLREKRQSGAELVATLRRLDALTHLPCLVSEDVDAAIQACAWGVHFADRGDLRAQLTAARAKGVRAGASAHSEESVTALRDHGADWVIFGPVRDTPKGDVVLPGCGFDVLRAMVNGAAPVPLIAIGGLRVVDERAVLDTGAAGWAAIRAFRSPATITR